MAKDNQKMSKNEISSDVNSGNNISLIPGYSTVEEFIKDGFKTLIDATKNSNSLPQDRDWDFYNTHQSFRDLMSSQGDSILCLINDVLKQQNVHGNIKSRNFQEKVELIIEANDIILERVANNLDEIAGIRKNPELPVEIQTVRAELPVNGSWNRLSNAKITVAATSTSSQNIPHSPNSVRLLTAKNIQRPQKFFKDKIDNSKFPWEPKIKDKPNNLKPLAVFLEETEDGLGEIFSHPYEFELSRFEPQAWQLTSVPAPVSLPKPLADTPLHIVETVEDLNRLLEALRPHREIAIDLEHHSYRSYLGFTCLMQISTPEEDFLVDTLSLRSELHILNEIFTKPTVLKIFHGADHDVQWLQRDLSLYVVNMFDTHQAAKQLNYSQLSLAYLLRRFCRVDADKRFQLADWRIRPLPTELKTYAREDTHYLLYIANMLRNELLQKGENVLRSVYTASTQICRKRYEKPTIHENSHLELYRRCKKMFDNRQMYALKALYLWRDSTAREEDESTGFVLPNHMLLQVAELLPREMQGILACCNPIPPLVRSNLLELHRIILKAREQSIVKAILGEESRGRGVTHQQSTKINVESVLNCPHDIARTEEFRDDLPTLLDNGFKENRIQQYKLDPELESQVAKLNIFDTPQNLQEENEKKNKLNSKIQRLKFLGPYERYKLVKKYVQAEEKKQEEKEKEEKEKQNKSTEMNETVAERTDSDRIKTLQEHFKTLATTAQMYPSTENTLDESTKEINPITLGQPVAKKRKREPSPSINDNDINKESENSIIDARSKIIPQTPLTNKQQNNNTPNKSNKKKKRNKHKHNMQTFNEQLHNKGNKKQNKQQASQQKQNNKNSINNQQNISKNLNQQQSNSQLVQSSSKNFSNKSPRDGKRKWNNNQNEEANSKRKRENSDAGVSGDFRPFDYSTVDFKQFQGGAGSTHQAKKINSNFKGKGSKNKKFDSIGRNNTRSSNFRERGGHRGGW